MSHTIAGYTIQSYLADLASGHVSADQVFSDYLARAKESTTNAYIRLTPDAWSTLVDGWRLRGLPMAIKDNILTKWYHTTCASAALEKFVAPYDATCYARLRDAGIAMVGKANLDEFAMGSSNETSFFGPVSHPLDQAYVPGGSSGWSAVAVAEDLCVAALGSDTGGSIRLPASLCGVVGYKPTYGYVSRYGVVAMASSLDQVGTLTKNVADAAYLTSLMWWDDPHDATSHVLGDDAFVGRDDTALLPPSDAVKEWRIALPRQFMDEGLDDDVRRVMLDLVAFLQKAGARVDEVDLPLLQYGVAVYYILMPAEVATNLARFDGIRFWHQWDSSQYTTIHEYYTAMRSASFGDEVQRRIMTGNYVLSAWFYDAYYRKAQIVRQQMIDEFSRLFGEYDMILGPTSPTVARRRGELTDDPLRLYMMDIYTVLANLAGLPALSLPVWSVQRDGRAWPVGAHLMANRRQDAWLLRMARWIEEMYPSP